jgi:hypothetical protein
VLCADGDCQTMICYLAPGGGRWGMEAAASVEEVLEYVTGVAVCSFVRAWVAFSGVVVVRASRNVGKESRCVLLRRQFSPDPGVTN